MPRRSFVIGGPLDEPRFNPWAFLAQWWAILGPFGLVPGGVTCKERCLTARYLAIGDFEKYVTMTGLIEATTAGEILAFQLTPNPFPEFRGPVDVITEHLLGFFIRGAIPTDNKRITEFIGSMYKLGIGGLLPTLSSHMTDDSFWHRERDRWVIPD